MKNVSTPGEEMMRILLAPSGRSRGITIYLEQQEGRKKQRLDRAARAAIAAAAAAEQAERGAQL
jgi:hypothetical protein